MVAHTPDSSVESLRMSGSVVEDGTLLGEGFFSFRMSYLQVGHSWWPRSTQGSRHGV
jgi:hypothetical protein